MDQQRCIPNVGLHTRVRHLCLVAVTLCLVGCGRVPSGPDEVPVSFALNFDFPYRVPLNGDPQEPAIEVMAGSHEIPEPAYRLESLNSNVVGVDETGRGLMGVARDTTSIRVTYTTLTGTTADTVFPVRPVVSAVKFRPGNTGAVCNPYCDNLSLRFSRLADTVPVEAVALDARGDLVANVDFLWVSGNTTVATVSSTGLVTALDEGSSLVTAQVDDVSGYVNVSVEQTAFAVEVAPDADTLHTVGRSVRFVAAAFDSLGGLLSRVKLRWSSTDTAVAVVDPVGVVTSTGSGAAQIVARVGEVADSATIVVDQVQRFLFVTPPLDTVIALDDTVRIDAVATDSLEFPIANPDVAWTSSDTAIVTVDSDGLVTAQANGTALVTATSDGQSASATVVVRQAPDIVSLAQDNLALAGSGDTTRLTVEVADRNGYPLEVPDPAHLRWRTLNPLVAFVDTVGLVSAFEDGVTSIVVSVADTTGASADTAVIAVTGAPPQEWIAFTSRNGLEVVAPASGARTVLTERHLSGPVWSPDGAALVGRFRSGEGCVLDRVDIGDRPQVRSLTQPSFYSECDTGPVWSPDGRSIAFARVGCGGWYCWGGIFTVAPDGSGLRDLRVDIPYAEVYVGPSWSPDGDEIVFHAWETNFSEGFGIYIVNLSSGTTRSVVPGNAYGPTWSPGGSLLAYVKDSIIWVSDPDGAGRRNLSSPAVPVAWDPLWSPDGNQLVFIGAENSTVSDLYVINADGTGLDRLTAGNHVRSAAWSPDGTRIVFGEGANSSSLYLVNVDGTGLRRLTFGGDVRSPAWRPRVAPTAPRGIVSAETLPPPVRER